MTTDDDRPDDPRVRRTRAAVVDTAVSLLVEGGVGAVTIEAIVRRSGVARSTIYRHWPSRTDVVAAAFGALAVLTLIVMRTKIGTAMRAVAEDKDAATLMGIDVNKVIVFTFALGGAMAGVAGLLYGLVFKQISFFMGFFLGVKGFGAAVFGGIGNIPGAMLGGFALGLVESTGPALFLEGLGVQAPYQLRDAIAYTMLVMVLIFRPRGLLGERLAARA